MDTSALRVVTKVVRAVPPATLRGSLASVPRLPPGPGARASVELLDAIHRFAPEVRLHPDDRYRPSSVPWYLQNVRMRRHRAWWPDVRILDVGEVNVNTLIAQRSGGQSSGQGADRTNFFLEIAANTTETRRGRLAIAECYVHFRRAPGTSTAWDLQYWFFYPYNGDITTGADFEHEGDFEHVTVRIGRDLRSVQEVFYHVHNTESTWRRPGEFSSTSEGHPIVYSARHTHATYWSAGKQARTALPDDHTADGGPVWQTWDHLRLVGHRRRPTAGQEWIRYTGHWGQIGTGFSWLGGPYGPAFQGYWLDDDSGG
ncbi:Vps62-related protein [Agrococcus sp. DT81.2]|uniref:Vps62-related protein n=1 Tax=Agrococcus sp. DT81.2 TaxID=3393414 RepID=UPI003CE4CD27